LKVGTIVKLEENDKVKLIRVVQETSRKIVITNASLSVNGNVTNFSVTFKNDGNTNATISGLTLHGLFNVSSTKMQNNQNDEGHNKNNDMEIEHPDTIPFKINGTSLVPLLGSDDDEHEGIGRVSSLTLQSGQSVTLSFSGVIQLKPEHDEEKEKSTPQTIITPILGETYTIRLMGEGYQTFNVTATAS
jgi:hypothetical protein